MAREGHQRLDRWLFFARIVKSRSLAARLVEAGKVRVNREKTVQPSRDVKAGDVLTVTLERQVLVLRLLAPGARRGPAAEARTLYEDLSPQPAAGEGDDRQSQPLRDPGSGRPAKKDRRAIDKLRGEP